MRAVLTVTGGPESDRQWTIDSDTPVTIGRGDQADIVLIDAEISRIHCRISCPEGQWLLEDKGSLNGTFVNGRKTGQSPLQHGDRVHLGNSALRFDEVAEQAEAPGPAPAVAMRTCSRCGGELPPGSTSCPVCDTDQPAAPAAVTVERPPTAAPIVTPAPPPAAAPLPRFAPPKITRVETEKTIADFIKTHPRETSNYVLSWFQKLWYPLIVLGMLWVLVYDYLYFLLFVHLLCTFYLVVIGHKLITIFLSVVWRWDIRLAAEQVAGLRDEELPVYTILLPLYREREVAEKVIRRISSLDYPQDKLDVKVLLEPDDLDTLEAIRETGLPDFCEVIICPESQPKTKPKACNHGLVRARGEYVVIYDAEDRPEPDQLKKALLGFRRADDRREQWAWLHRINPASLGLFLISLLACGVLWLFSVSGGVVFAEDSQLLPFMLTFCLVASGLLFVVWLVGLLWGLALESSCRRRGEDFGRTVCLQAKLNYYNPRQNLLTRWFMIEYATWFQLYLPGLHALRAPIPLGGTSNHFRTGVLQKIRGWDPFNVTEDCDLGIRLHKMGYRTQVIDSITWEEANSRMGNWIRQRSRWVKGYLQTHFTHMRRPFRTLWQLRPWGMFNFLNSVGGLSLMLLLNPIFWVVSLLYIGLFITDLQEHNGSVSEAIGVEQAIKDAADVRVGRDRTIRLPHPGRRAWPMVCTGWSEDTPPDMEWDEVIWRGIQKDWAVVGGALRTLWTGGPGGIAADGQRIEPVVSASNDAAGGASQRYDRPTAGPGTDAEPGDAPTFHSRGEAWRELWADEGFHFWNVVSQALFVCTLALVLGNVFFALVHVIACLRARIPELIPFAIAMPLYWVIISVGAWKGFFQLLYKPFYWEKTQHGLDVGSAEDL